METFALAARPFAVSTWLAAGAWPRTAPPWRAETADRAAMESADLVYLCLHGEGDAWYGGDWTRALTVAQLRDMDLSGAIVYLAGCFGVGPMASAVIDARARAVIGDRSGQFAGYLRPTGSNALGRLVVRALRSGATVSGAAEWASWEYLKRRATPRDIAMIRSMAIVGDRQAVL